MQRLKSIEKLIPFTDYKIWGGQFLARQKGLAVQNNKGEGLGETWEVSTHKNGPSLTANGVIDRTLPYLVKFIDTSDHLSVQVHPNDDYASRLFQEKGKTECWLILNATTEAKIFLGFKDGVTKEQVRAGIKNKENLSLLMNSYYPEAGDFFFVPAGTVHAIGAGVTMVEIQQSSGLTFRLWDWNRVDKDGRERELHVDDALNVLSFGADQIYKTKKNIWASDFAVDHADFQVRAQELKERTQMTLSHERGVSVVVLEGKIKLSREKTEVVMQAFESAYLTADYPEHLSLEPLEKKCKYLIIF